MSSEQLSTNQEQLIKSDELDAEKAEEELIGI